MQAPPEEPERLRALERYPLLDPAAEPAFERIVRLAAGLFDVPITSVALVDRDEIRFAATYGLELPAIRREGSFSAYTILSDDVMVVPDARADPRFLEHPLVAGDPGVRFHAGAPIITPDGYRLGALCIMDTRPRELDSKGRALLADLAAMTMIALEVQHLEDQSEYHAKHDALTGLPNRLLFEDRVQNALARAERNQQIVALLFLDLDGFKAVNDSWGHHTGDATLRQLARRLERNLRQTDTVARIGGDEFAIVLGELDAPEAAVSLSQRVLATVERPLVIRDETMHLTASVGISLYPKDGGNVAELLRKADHAMYRAKDQGKNRIQIYAAQQADGLDARTLEEQLRVAITQNELVLHYQPQIDLASGAMVGLEALVRWRHPDLGLVLPADFLQVAEDSGLIVPIGAWVLQEACRQGKLWQQLGHESLSVLVNVSPAEFSQNGFVDIVTQAFEGSGLDPHTLVLEVPERLLLQDGAIASRLNVIGDLGVRFAVEDFVDEDSTLDYLQQLPISVVKIDRSFVRDLHAGRPSASRGFRAARTIVMLVRAATTLSHVLGIRIVAEGVEHEEQLAFLRRLGCDGMQGYLVSRPLPASQFESLLRGVGASDM